MFDWFKRNGKKGDRGEVIPEPHDGLPDSSHMSGLCPRCGKQSSFKPTGSLPVSFDGSYTISRDGNKNPESLDRVSSLLCQHCGQGTVVIEEQWIGDHPAREGIGSGGYTHYRGIHWWPLPETKLSTDIPTQISEAFAEAATALQANCPRASAVMARRVLEAITVDNGQTSGTLASRLEILATQGILQPTLADWAREVRLVGNSGAHYDVLNIVSSDDAHQLLDFIRQLLRYLYELPADLARRRSSTP